MSYITRMNCIKCGLDKIRQNIAFLCSEKHIQCKDCNEETLGKCGLCSSSTFLMEFMEERRVVVQQKPKEMTDFNVVAKTLNSGTFRCFRPLTITVLPVVDDPNVAIDEERGSTASENDPTKEETADIFKMDMPSNKTQRVPLILKPLSSCLYRALCNPAQNYGMPPPQCKRIDRNWPTQEQVAVQVGFLNDWYKQSNLLTISRVPITCSVGNCGQTVFVADYNNHLIVDHVDLKWDTIAKSECKSFRVDPRTVRKCMNTCQMLYLINNDDDRFNSDEMRHMLPLLVMSTRYCPLDDSEVSTTQAGTKTNEYLMIWVTGFRPEEFPITANLVLWSRGKVPARRVKTGEILCIRSESSHKDVFYNMKSMVLSAAEIDLFTNKGANMLEMQLVLE